MSFHEINVTDYLVSGIGMHVGAHHGFRDHFHCDMSDTTGIQNKQFPVILCTNFYIILVCGPCHILLLQVRIHKSTS